MSKENNLFTKEILQEIENSLSQKHDHLLDLAALDAIPTEILPILKPHIQKSIALSPITSPRILIDLTNCQYVDVRKALLRNRDIFPQLLETLNQDNSKEVRYLVKNHFQKPAQFSYYSWHLSPNYYLPSEDYSEEDHSEYCYDFAYVQQMASNPSTTPDALRDFSADKSWLLKHRVAMNPSTAPDTLANLAEDTSKDKIEIPRIKMAVAKNPNTDSQTLVKLIKNDCDTVVCEVAKNPNLTIDLQYQLAKQSNPRIRKHLATNPNIAQEIIEYLANNHLQCCLKSILENSQCPQHFLLDIDNYSSQCLILVAQHQKTPIDILEKLSSLNQVSQHDIDKALAYNQNTSTNTLTQIYHRAVEMINLKKKSWQISRKSQPLVNLKILIGIAINQNTSPTILNQLKKIDIAIDKHFTNLFVEENIPTLIILEKLVAYYEHKFSNNNYVHPYSGLASNPKTPIFVLKELAKISDNWISELLAKNNSTPVDILNCLYHKKSKRVKQFSLNRMIAIYEETTKNPQTSIEDLHEILHHENAEVRHTLQHHPQGVPLLLGRCLQHKNSLSRFLAALHPQLSLSQRQELMNSNDKFDRLAIKFNFQS